MGRLSFGCALVIALMCAQVPTFAEKQTAPSNLLVDSKSEAAEKLEQQRKDEQEDLRELWDALCKRSPDLEFVWSKVKDRTISKETFETIKAKALVGAMGVENLVSMRLSPIVIPGDRFLLPGTRLDNKDAHSKRLSQSEVIMLYDLVRRQGDKLVELYQKYVSNKHRMDAMKVGHDEQVRVRLLCELQETRAKLVEFVGTEAMDAVDKRWSALP